MNIFLLHTVRPGLDTFESKLQERYPGHNVYNYLNDYWNRKMLTEKQGFSKKSLLYLLHTCQGMQYAGADIIVCTCNSLTPYLLQVREYIDIPIIPIDEKMPAAVLKSGQRVLVVATAGTSADAAARRIEEAAKDLGISCSLTVLCREDAGIIMRAGGDMTEHDRIVVNAVAESEPDGFDIVLLTQLSTAHLKTAVINTLGLPVITTPDICLDELNEYFSLLKLQTV